MICQKNNIKNFKAKHKLKVVKTITAVLLVLMGKDFNFYPLKTVIFFFHYFENSKDKK